MYLECKGIWDKPALGDLTHSADERMFLRCVYTVGFIPDRRI